MHDIKIIRQNPDVFERNLRRRGVSDVVPSLLELDQHHRSLLTELQTLLARRNQIAKDFGMCKQQGLSTDELHRENEEIKKRLIHLDQASKESEVKLHECLSHIPNIPASDCPEGFDESSNQEIRRVMKPRMFDFEVKPHDVLGKELKMMDFERSAKLSGSRFVVLYGALARLEKALSLFMLDIQTREFGYTEVYPPLLVRDDIMFGTGQLPKFHDDQFRVDYHTNLWLIPTAEVVLTNLVAQEILDEGTLPKRYTAYTPCFRAEAGSAGRDTHGLIRQHQFGKVEVVSITTPDQVIAEHERMTEAAETVLKRLELPYRVLALCAGDMGFSAEKTYDIEVWMPSQNMYREISSCSRCSDFQARRMNARYRSSEDGKLHFVHTLNGSALAVGRTLAALLENYQRIDGSIEVPHALIPYMNGLDVISC